MVIETARVAPATIAVTVSFSMLVARALAVPVNLNDDEFPGILTEVGTVRFAELLVMLAANPLSGAAGDRLPVHSVFSPGMSFAGVQASEVIEYVIVADATILSVAAILTVPAAAVMVADCTGVVPVVVTEKVTLLDVQPTVTDVGAVMPVPVLVIAIL
jgi:hypothetical protein